MQKILVALLCYTALVRAQDVVWYIGNNGSSDLATCGRVIENPCASFNVILQDSPLFENGTSSCRVSNNDNDGRSSTTVNFLEGVHFVDPVCLSNWDNLTIVGLGTEVTITTRIGGRNGLFDFIDCSRIKIANINFDTAFIGRSTLFFSTTRDISIADCSFSLETANTRGVEIVQSSGIVTVSRCTFTGNPELASQTDNYVLGLSIVHGCEQSGSQSTPCLIVNPSIMLTVTDSVFYYITSGGTPNDNYSASKARGTSLRVRFLRGSHNNLAVLNNITVIGSHSEDGSNAIVNYDMESSDNTVLFTNSKFIGNYVRYGGGISAYFVTRPSNSSLIIEDCVFKNNHAAFEGGGVFAAFLSTDETNSVSVTASVFSDNTAILGGGIFLLSNPNWFSQRGLFDPIVAPLVSANLTDCVFINNSASLKEGVINTLRIRLFIGGNSLFNNNTGSGLFLRFSLAFLSGEVSFLGNIADSGAGINVREGSKVDMSNVTKGLFAHNKVVFSGGAIYADSASTSKLAVEYNHTLSQSAFGSCFMIFGNELTARASDPIMQPERFIFFSNSAVQEGQSISSFSLRGCILANFVPVPAAGYLRIQPDGTISYKDSSILDNTSTGPSNLFFYGTSTKCYKTVADRIYLLPNCSHSLLSETFLTEPDLRCGLNAFFNYDLSNLYTPGTGLRPPLDKLFTPWASIEASWTLAPGFARSQCAEPNPSNLFLAPAPGEMFDITIQLADQLLNYVSATIFMDIEHEAEVSPGVLLQLNGIQYAFNDRVYFTPNRALSGLALVGLPGSSGKLRVVADSQVMGESIQLLIPFQLSQCPLGYFNPVATTPTQVNSLIMTEYDVTQRIPSDQKLACRCFAQQYSILQTPPSQSVLGSECVQGYTVTLSSSFWAGRISRQASSSQMFPEAPCPSSPSDFQPFDDNNYTAWVAQSRRTDETNGVSAGFDPVDVVAYNNRVIPGGGAPVICYNTSNVSELIGYKPPGEFTVDICTRGYCRGDAESSWSLSDVNYPCIEDREGVLCGQCRENFAVTLYTTTCYDCRGKLYQGVIALLITLLGGVFLVFLAIAFKLGVSATIDTMLFFIQAVLILLSGRTDYSIFTYYLPFFNPDFSLNLCITPDLTAFARLLLQFATPLYILILLIIVLLLGRYTRLSRFLGRHSFLQGIWLLVLISYFNIANTSFELLHCRTITSLETGVTQYILTHDASVECFVGKHLIASIIVIIIMVIFILFFPIYLLTLYLGWFGSVRFKPIIDVFTSRYKDSRRWWVIASINRRLLLVLVGVFIQDYVWRHFALFLCIGVTQFWFVTTWPYQSWVDNYFRLVVGWALLFIALISQPALYLYVDLSRAVSMTTVVMVILSSLCLVILEIVLQYHSLSTEIYLEKLGFNFSTWWSNSDLLKRRKRSLSTSSRNIHELEDSTPPVITVNQRINSDYREPLLDSMASSSNNLSLASSRKFKDSCEKSRRWRVKKKSEMDSFASKETMQGHGMPTGNGRVSVTVVEPEDGTSYGDSGEAATSYFETN